MDTTKKGKQLNNDNAIKTMEYREEKFSLTLELDEHICNAEIIGSGSLDMDTVTAVFSKIEENEFIKVINITVSGFDSVGVGAFFLREINSVVLCEGVSSIGENAFKGCEYLVSAYLPTSLLTIGKGAFMGCRNLNSVNLPYELEAIEEYAFKDCRHITSVLCTSKQLASIGKGAFEACVGLRDLTIPAEDVSVHENAFRGCNISTAYVPIAALGSVPKEGLNKITVFGEGAIGNNAFLNCRTLTSIVMHEGITAIGDYAFYGCDSLARLVIPSTVSSIGSDAFEGCTAIELHKLPSGYYLGSENNPYLYLFKAEQDLRSIVIDKGTLFINNSAFEHCKNLVSIDVEEENPRFASLNGALYTDNGDVLLKYPQAKPSASFIVPEGVERIAPSAFRDANLLKIAVIPDTVKEIGSYAFAGCQLLNSVSILSENIRELDNSLFKGCQSLTTINIPQSVERIGAHAFYGCKSLIGVTLPRRLEFIGSGAFGKCDTVVKFSIPSACASIEPRAFSGCSSLCEISVDGDNPAYKSLDGCLYTKDITRLLQYTPAKGDTKFTLSEGTEVIESGAFEDSIKLEAITLADSITAIRSDAFDGCERLECNEYEDAYYFGTEKNPYLALIKSKSEDIISCKIHEDTKLIADNAFRGCSSLANLLIPAGVKYIGSCAFSGCDALRLFCKQEYSPMGWDKDWNPDKLPVSWGYDTVPVNEKFEYSVINGGAILTKYKSTDARVVIPEGIDMYPVTDFGTIFKGNSLINEVIIPGTVEKISDGAFADCKSLSSIKMKDGTRHVGNNAFKGCVSLPSISLPSTLESIGSSAFAGCKLLEAIEIPIGVTAINERTFRACARLKSVHIPKSVKSIGTDAFIHCHNLVSINIPEGVLSIDANAFYGCQSLAKIAIAKSVSQIGENAFFGCNSLTVYCASPSKPAGWDLNWSAGRPVVWGEQA